MRNLLFLLMLIVCQSVMGAELLVQVVDAPTPQAPKKYDVIAVRPDGWTWGTKEGLPQFVVVKLPGVPESEVKFYEDQLIEVVCVDQNDPATCHGEIVRKRKNYVTSKIFDTMKTGSISKAFVASKDIAKFKTDVKAKDLAAEKVKVEAEKVK